MSATARAPLVRAGPGVSAWTALPERDRALLLWLERGGVVTAEVAALLSYGHRRIAQHRLVRIQRASHPTVALIDALIGDIGVTRVTMGATRIRAGAAAGTKADSLRSTPACAITRVLP